MGVDWYVQSTGAETNAGAFDATLGGTNYAMLDAPVATGTATSVGSTLTATTGIFTAAMVGNYVIGSTTRKKITAYTSSTVVTLESAPSWTAQSVKVGGALATPGLAAGLLGTLDRIWLKSGNYTASATPNVSGGCVQLPANTCMVGYTTTPGDAVFWGSMPSVKATADNMFVFAAADYNVGFANVEADGDNANRATTDGFGNSGAYYLQCINCRAKNSARDGFRTLGSASSFYFCEATGCTGSGFIGGQVFESCWSHGNTTGFYTYAKQTSLVDCIANGNTGSGVTFDESARATRTICYGNGSAGFDLDPYGNGPAHVALINCVSYGNSALNYSTTTTSGKSYPTILLLNCAGGGGGGNFHSTDLPALCKVAFITLSAVPFTAPGSNDFSINATAGGGASLRAAGYGTVGPTVGYPDVGAAQSRNTAPSAGNVLTGSGTFYSGNQLITPGLTQPDPAYVLSTVPPYGVNGTGGTGTAPAGGGGARGSAGGVAALGMTSI